MTTRRSFLATLAAPFVTSAAPRELHADIAIIGASVGGCAAALAALRNGMRVVLTEETDWIGGQLTSQAVPPDEHPWIEQFGCTRSYREYRNAVRQYYRDHYPLTEDARQRANFNPGDGSVSKLTHEPKVSLAVLEAMLAPYASAGR
jgi:NADPH-dependent 2,4-dienoyl-CoA reductase/sulfur reductase-like enzyme